MISVVMEDNRFRHVGTIPPGQVVFEVYNADDVEHELVLLPLPEEAPSIQEQLHGPKRLVVLPFASVPPVEPGGRATFASDLLPGQRYAFACFLANKDGVQYALLGMTSEFRAGQPNGTAD